jgi:hypothetical protein
VILAGLESNDKNGRSSLKNIHHSNGRRRRAIDDATEQFVDNTRNDMSASSAWRRKVGLARVRVLIISSWQNKKVGSLFRKAHLCHPLTVF